MQISTPKLNSPNRFVVISEWQTFASLADYSVLTEIRLSLGPPNFDSGPLGFSSQVMVRFFSEVL